MRDGTVKLEVISKFAGDEAPECGTSMAALYERYWDEIRLYVKKTFGMGPPEPEDVAQAAFAKFAAILNAGAIENPRAFLYATARNIVVDHHRHLRSVKLHAVEILQRNTSDRESEFSPEHVLLDREQLRILAAALRRMPERRRQMVILSRFDGLTCREIAMRFGVSESNVQKQIMKAMAEFMKDLGKE